MVVGAAHATYISLLCQLDVTARLRHYDAYTVALTDYAASYIAPMGASPMGRLRNPPRSESLQGNEAYQRRDSQPL